MQCDLHSSLSDCLIEYMHILKIDLTAHRYHPCVQLSRKRPLESSCQSLQFTSSCVQHYNLKLSMEHGKPCHLEYLCDQAKKIHRSNHYQPACICAG
ncbi:hypothetical protein MPTK1_4g09310 [Marchantia polymorpha subsp. ruderalis]|uniref:Uncharacterized protein n=2 Tax=Marchantia polymorpha TaxID=3197 RepID=A0AAF6B824_MARPO|nr:hypothetical protein MARPO_0112s0031 [Marchantia polymorpha]PTQ31381.1 hypothetical protein MARPO_0112s0031 [Marchantia polymorpha]BBN08157.1 hypothetical protein Mp_4g09310 [Marchantia polymorpha subsp. ruderalis]BBN08158.1 hypothetical protein Mp_4g09310 [Marchantia polymorpha subsp. ruderalis]|eukprot:PTQ31380.1 hypothetical protein MARPO_0112s0031 [Marchantia polymorpha]